MNLELDELICRFECAILSRPNPPDSTQTIHDIAYVQALKHIAMRNERELREQKAKEMVGV